MDSEERSETSTFHSSRYEREGRALQKIRVMGHVDYENCLRDLLPRCSKSQCVTRANRLFEKVEKECWFHLVFQGTLSKQVNGWSLLYFAGAYIE